MMRRFARAQVVHSEACVYHISSDSCDVNVELVKVAWAGLMQIGAQGFPDDKKKHSMPVSRLCLIGCWAISGESVLTTVLTEIRY